MGAPYGVTTHETPAIAEIRSSMPVTGAATAGSVTVPESAPHTTLAVFAENDAAAPGMRSSRACAVADSVFGRENELL
jgi:hypothetical protein